MSHPASCTDPTCTLSYARHLTFAVSSSAMPTRRPDAHLTNIREKRWVRDGDAFDRLTKQGYDVPEIDGARARERYAENDFDIEHGVTVKDWEDPT